MELDLLALAETSERQLLDDPPPGMIVHSSMLHDTDLVVRGGRNSLQTLQAGLETTRRKTDRHLSAVSAASGRGRSVEEILSLYPLPNTSICFTTVGQLRSTRIGVMLTGLDGHCSILIPTGTVLPDVAWLAMLAACFEGPIDNPSRSST